MLLAFLPNRSIYLFLIHASKDHLSYVTWCVPHAIKFVHTHSYPQTIHVLKVVCVSVCVCVCVCVCVVFEALSFLKKNPLSKKQK